MRFAIAMSLCAALSFAQTMGGSYIGVGMQEVDRERAKALKLAEPSGVEITSVMQDSPAEKAGLKVGDVVLKYNGQKVEGNEQFARMVRETPAGREVKIEISRGGAWQQVMVKVAVRKPQAWGEGQSTMMPPMQLQLPDLAHAVSALRSVALGVEAEAIDGQLAQYFGVKEGVLVRSVVKGSPADKAGIKAGDIVLRVDDAKVMTPAEISMKARTLHGKPVPVVLMRDHKELTVTVTFEDAPGGMIQITPFQVHQPN